MITNANITLYNKFIDPSTRDDAYTITHLYGVHFEGNKAVNVLKSGLLTADSVTVHIPFLVAADNGLAWENAYFPWEDGNMRWDGQKTYKPPKEFLKDITNSWTLQEGDLIVKGIVTEMDLKKLKEKHDFVYAITSIDTLEAKTLRMSHWEVGGI